MAPYWFQINDQNGWSKSPCRTGSDSDTIQHPMTAARLFAASSWAQTLFPKPVLQRSRTIDTAGGAPVTQAFRKPNPLGDAQQRVSEVTDLLFRVDPGS